MSTTFLWIMLAGTFLSAGVLISRFLTRLRALQQENADLRQAMASHAIQLQVSERRLKYLTEDIRVQDVHLGKFLSIVAHDLRNPLMIIRSSTELVAEEIDSKKDVLELSGFAHAAALRMESIIDELLTDRGKKVRSDLQPSENLDFSKFVENLCVEFRQASEEKVTSNEENTSHEGIDSGEPIAGNKNDVTSMPEHTVLGAQTQVVTNIQSDCRISGDPAVVGVIILHLMAEVDRKSAGDDILYITVSKASGPTVFRVGNHAEFDAELSIIPHSDLSVTPDAASSRDTLRGERAKEPAHQAIRKLCEAHQIRLKQYREASKSIYFAELTFR
jgi:hypothetical protein